MKKIFCLLIIFAVFPLYAVNWDSAGYNIVARGENDDIVLQKGNWRFLVINESETKDSDLAGIDRMNEIFSTWQFIKIRSIKYVVNPGSIDVFLIPRTYDYNGKSYMENVVAGIHLVYVEESLRYNFRIKRGQMFLKISGAYIEEEVLCKKVEEAVADPQSFIQRRDADFLLTQIERLEGKIDSLTADNLHITRDIEAIKETDARQDTTDRQVIQQLNKTTATAKKNNKYLVAFTNGRFFYSPKPIEQEKINKILQMRRQYPNLEINDLMKKFEEEDYKVTKKEVEIVLQAFNNEFKED